jgi:predicted nicotinamide N-methyase
MEARAREGLDIAGIRDRFGLKIRTHRIRDIALRVAEVERVDEMVAEVYPGAVLEHGDAPVWMITWPAALALAEHVVEMGVERATVLELGCGTAAPGIAARLAGGIVTCTDYDQLTLMVARHNAFELLDWYHPRLRGRFDVILGSEIVYHPKSFPALMVVLARYLAPGGRVLLSDQGRPQMAGFLDMCERASMYHRIHDRLVHLPEQSREIRIVTLEFAS